MGLEMIILNEVGQEKGNHLYVKSKKNKTNELTYKAETASQTHRLTEETYDYQCGKMERII